MVELLIFGADEAGQRLSDQCSPRSPQQGRGGEIGLQNKPLVIERDKAHRRQLIQVKTVRPGGFQLLTGPLQLLVLQFQLYLMYPEFMGEVAGGFRCN